MGTFNSMSHAGAYRSMKTLKVKLWIYVLKYHVFNFKSSICGCSDKGKRSTQTSFSGSRSFDQPLNSTLTPAPEELSENCVKWKIKVNNCFFFLVLTIFIWVVQQVRVATLAALLCVSQSLLKQDDQDCDGLVPPEWLLIDCKNRWELSQLISFPCGNTVLTNDFHLITWSPETLAVALASS